MTKPRRRQAGEGRIVEYRTKAGVRYAIKYRVPREDGPDRQVLLRRTRDRQPMMTRGDAAKELARHPLGTCPWNTRRAAKGDSR